MRPAHRDQLALVPAPVDQHFDLARLDDVEVAGLVPLVANDRARWVTLLAQVGDNLGEAAGWQVGEKRNAPQNGGERIHRMFCLLMKYFHSALGFRFPLPRAGEGQGEGVAGQSAHQRGSLTLALSQRERAKAQQCWSTGLSWDW